MEKEKIIEALLFVAGDPLSIKDLARLSGLSRKDIEDALNVLEQQLDDRGVRLIRNGEEATLATAPEVSEIADKVTKERLEGDLSRPALEVLSIVLWKNKVSRTGIDYIRGVNSAFSLKTLLMRGLVERKPDPKDSRVFLYSPTLDLLKFLGISSLDKLPQFEDINKDLKEYE